jgi:UDP-glucose 4-epimerase
MAGPVVVTGGAGFIGRRLVRHLVDQGVNVCVVDLVSSPASGSHEIIGDLRDPAVLEDVARQEPSGIFHLAARTSVLASMQEPDTVFDVNAGVTQRLLEIARRQSIPKFVLASTNAVVGEMAFQRIDEQTPLLPLTAYGATKAAGEMLCSAYSASYGIGATPVRLTNVYGPGMQQKDSLVARLLRAVSAGDDAKVYGDGTQVRDYVFVDDAVSGLLIAWDTDLRGPLVIGSGVSSSVRDVVRTVRVVTGLPLPDVSVDAPVGEMPAVRVDISRARALGFEPATDLRTGLERTWAVWQASDATEAGR